MFDFSALLSGMSSLSGMQGLNSTNPGTSPGTNPSGAFFARGPDGGISGLTQHGQRAIGNGIQDFARALPGGYTPSQYTQPQGAFTGGHNQATQNAPQGSDPNEILSQSALAQILNRHRFRGG